jgi:hypothetical protein
MSLICNFEFAADTMDWLILARTKSRCGHEVQIGEPVSFAAGEVVTVPAPSSPDEVIVGRVVLNTTTLNTMLDKVFKPASSALAWDQQGQLRRIVRAHEGAPFVMTIPASVGWPSRFGGDTTTTSLTFNESGVVTFYRVTVAKSGA